MTTEHGKRPRIDARKYAGQWVAVHPETLVVVAHDESEQRARQAAWAQGTKQPLLYHVRKSDAHFVGPASRVCR